MPPTTSYGERILYLELLAQLCKISGNLENLLNEGSSWLSTLPPRCAELEVDGLPSDPGVQTPRPKKKKKSL